MKKITIGILAHVDSGKTTLSESLLYLSGKIKNLGRVDHKNAYLDTHKLEKLRGITIFSKQAHITLDDTEIYLLDTPGHVDFSAETERTLSVLDYAILVINATDGIQSHTETLFSLLKSKNIPTFVFINKMDLITANSNSIIAELCDRFVGNFIDFTHDDFIDNLATSNEHLLEEFLETSNISDTSIKNAIKYSDIYPCFFGSALKMQGTDEFSNALSKYTISPIYDENFSAKVYKISRDDKGNRLTHLKITGGNLLVKDKILDEKIHQIRVYSGEKFEVLDRAFSGDVIAVTGLTKTYAGQNLGLEDSINSLNLQPVLTYLVILPDEIDEITALKHFKILEEEDPLLHISFENDMIILRLMGEIQLEILTETIKERFGFSVIFKEQSIVYKETIKEEVFGAGHFEPLRHYAEVHLKLTPLERNSGIIIDSDCDKNSNHIKNLVISHLNEKIHTGILTNSELTDVKITFIAGKSHEKHTEGGDFREATFRALRQALLKSKPLLLEPYYNFKIEVPSINIGRVISDITNMEGSYNPPETLENSTQITGSFPVSKALNYASELISFTKGFGKISLSVKGFDECKNSNEIIKSTGYDPLTDPNNTGNSVFCSHGSGYTVAWNEADDHMHIKPFEVPKMQNLSVNTNEKRSLGSSDKELLEIFERTYGKIKQNELIPLRDTHSKITSEKEITFKLHSNECVLVDGYNVLFAWECLKGLDLESAKSRLLDMLINFSAYTGKKVLLVYDAYKVKGGIGSHERHKNLDIIYTKEAETADMYIEKTTHEIGRNIKARVVTSDRLQQIIILGHGALRTSARAFEIEVNSALKDMRELL